MPLIEVTAFEQRFASQDDVDRLIGLLTQALVDVYGEASRSETWVVLHPVPCEHWGFGGKVRQA